MKPKLIHKKIGKVDVFEMQGEFVGKTSEFNDKLTNSQSEGVLFNLDQVEAFDETTIDAINEKVKNIPKRALLAKNPEFNLVTSKSGQVRFNAYQSERVAAFYLASEFVEGLPAEVDLGDKRRFPRLKAARPLRFYFDKPGHGQVEFFSIVTNISKSGLFAEFIETKSENNVLMHLNVYDFQMLELDLHLTPTETIHLRAKLVRANTTRSGVAMEFYDSDPSEKKRLEEWIETEQAS